MNPVMWLDDIGKPAWIALMIVSFIMFWPAGFVVLGYLIGSGRMGCWTHNRGERWQRRFERRQQRMQARTARWRSASAPPGEKLERRLGAQVGVCRGDVIRIARQHD